VGNDQYAIGHPHTKSLSPSTPIERLLVVIVRTNQWRWTSKSSTILVCGRGMATQG